MQPTLFTKEEMQREFAIMQTVKAYNEEINWYLENEKTKSHMKIVDPSKAFITAQQKRDFEAWYPVS